MIDFEKILSIGDKIQVISLEKFKGVEYVSQVANVHKSYIDIFNPIYKNALVYFRFNEKLKIIVIKPEVILEFKSKVVERGYGKIPVLRLEPISELRRIQRREYFRLKILKSFEYKVIDDKNKKGEAPRLYSGIILDISGGGVLFSSKHDLDQNDLIEFELPLGKDGKIILTGKVVRKQYNVQQSFLYEYGVKFEDLNTKDKELLIKFIFDEQRRLLKKGLI